MQIRLSIIVLLIFFSLLAASLEAACTGTSVAAFGAKGDGQTDDSAAIQNAINAAARRRVSARDPETKSFSILIHCRREGSDSNFNFPCSCFAVRESPLLAFEEYVA